MTEIGKQVIDQTVQIGSVSFNREDVLGNGSFAIVFRGKYEGSIDVAIKRIVKFEVNKFERDFMPTIENHPNIIHFFCVEEDVDFM